MSQAPALDLSPRGAPNVINQKTIIIPIFGGGMCTINFANSDELDQFARGILEARRNEAQAEEMPAEIGGEVGGVRGEDGGEGEGNSDNDSDSNSESSEDGDESDDEGLVEGFRRVVIEHSSDDDSSVESIGDVGLTQELMF